MSISVLVKGKFSYRSITTGECIYLKKTVNVDLVKKYLQITKGSEIKSTHKELGTESQ